MKIYIVYLHKYNGQWDGEILYAGDNPVTAYNVANNAEVEKYYYNAHVDVIIWIDGKEQKELAYFRKIM